MTTKNKYFETVLEDFLDITKEPDNFLNSGNIISSRIKTNLKQTYDFSKSEEKNITSYALPELIIKNFDLEQIWQQIELQNDTLLAKSIANTSKLIVKKDDLLFTNLKEKMHCSEHNEDEEINTSFGEVDVNIDERNTLGSENESDEIDLNDKNCDDDWDQSNSDDKGREFEKKSVVDDEFFKLEEMEHFLNTEEKKMQNLNMNGNDSEGSESDEEHSIDLFEDDSDAEDEKLKTAKFKDFFVAADDKKPKRNKFLEDIDDELDDPVNNNEVKSSLEARQERLKKKIEIIEQTAIGEKPWQLKGEITAAGRPQNSLLEEIVEFDLTSKPAPVITEHTTLQLEDIIKQRIKDRSFDSVVRKIKPVETPLEYKKKLVLDQEKSKQSLAQIYEKEFLEQEASLNPENIDKEEVEPELHKELFPELKIINNLPAINMEEVAPVASSDAALLAPEEVKNKVKGEVIGKSERTTADKNRERRKKKLKQRAHLKEKQKREVLVNKLNPGLGNKYSKEKARKLLQQVTKERNVEKMDESVGAKNVKSSKAFFTQLQEEVITHISNKVKSKKRKRNDDQLEAKKIKL
ncbi:hypothetical protein NQ314_013302 [Rhamnusium bicolor]|uniref:U3 small nucleolar ribonucleoprotein protein MPP10 n=1 Tax=Rhamnusium bicolor TaxID=1586634 RepID=A0AAV8X7M1_9CUCU|nr:hypothetical protein NQ314_013302 [Rhamnusium bicolor]